MKVTLVSGATATTASPSGAPPPFGTTGKPLVRGKGVKTSAGDGFFEGTNEALCVVEGTATGGTPTVTVRLWGWLPFANGGAGRWFPLGVASDGTDAKRGELNNGTAIGAIDTNILAHSERILGLAGFQAMYAQIVAIAGTNTTVNVYLSEVSSQQA